MSSQSTLNSSSRHTKASPKNLLHVLSISAAVTRLRWRPPAGDTLVLDDDEDRHEAMLAVSTAPIKGASAGGSGAAGPLVVSPVHATQCCRRSQRWSCHRFRLADTPQPVQLVHATATGGSHQKQSAAVDARQFRRQGSLAQKWMPFYTITVGRRRC
jgi:hypothetical protein